MSLEKNEMHEFFAIKLFKKVFFFLVSLPHVSQPTKSPDSYWDEILGLRLRRDPVPIAIGKGRCSRKTIIRLQDALYT